MTAILLYVKFSLIGFGQIFLYKFYQTLKFFTEHFSRNRKVR
jgi:hypothetical protein